MIAHGGSAKSDYNSYMDQATILKLNQINYDFYELEAESFSRTRQRAWTGWEKWWQIVSPTLPLKPKVVDIGCGNGRLQHFLATHSQNSFKYLGLDASAALLKIAKNGPVQNNTRLVEVDMLGSQIDKYLPEDHYDLAAMFGVIHHVPGQNNRLQIAKKAWRSVKTGGWLAINFWQFGVDQKYLNKVIPWFEVGVNTKDLEEGDILLPWQNSRHRRYCHYCLKREIDQLTTFPAVEERQTFLADGQSQRLNRYVLLRKKK